MQSFLNVNPTSDFSLANLPLGVFNDLSSSSSQRRCIGTALGDHVINVAALQQAGLLSGNQLRGDASNCLQNATLNEFMALGRPAWRELREVLGRLLSSSEGALRDNTALRQEAIIPMATVQMHLPASIGDYTDFYASRAHATNVGTMFRGKDNALQPNWLHLPVGYHGRSSSIVTSGCGVHRPRGQVLKADSSTPVLQPSAAVDFELELACFIGNGNELGSSISVEHAEQHIFGYVLMNDWSARDIQKWEYVPLGPFNGKNWATQISPWIVSPDALQPFALHAQHHGGTSAAANTAANSSPNLAGDSHSTLGAVAGSSSDDPPVLPYLQHPTGSTVQYDVPLSVEIVPAGHRTATTVTSSNARHLYWSFSQMIAHHTIGGCNLRPGDLLGSGTISGPSAGQEGSLLELSWGGSRPVQLRGDDLDDDKIGGTSGINTAAHEKGVVRRYLEDGDTVVLRGGAGGGVGQPARVGFGMCSGHLLPCRPLQTQSKV